MKSFKTVVVVSNGITPYGVHFLGRVAAELHEYRLRTIYSYEFSMGHWSIKLPDSIDALILGKGEEAIGQKGKAFFLNGWRRGLELIREIKKSKPAAVMILGYGNFSHIVVIAWCKREGIPCLMWGDSNILADKNVGLKAFVKKVIVSKVVSMCSAILPCGSLGARYFQKYGARTEQIFFVPNEPNYSLIENIALGIVAETAEKYGLKANRHRLIYSGRLVPVKRVDLLLDAFVQIADERLDWDLLVAGDGPLKPELFHRIPERLRNRVIWTGFIDSPEKMGALFKLSDVMVLPSDYEPWALVVNEAACAGLALVCSNVVGAAAELLHDGENGRIFQASNADSLIDALMDVTDATKLDGYKAMSPVILQDWRQKADPVEGFRRALDFCLSHAGYSKTS